jgi:branched-chain amino acid transport system permease protein
MTPQGSQASGVGRFDGALTRAVGGSAHWVVLAGAVGSLVAALLPWTFDESFSVDLTVLFYPAGEQVFLVVLAVVAAVLVLLRGRVRGWQRAVRIVAAASFAVAVLTVVAVAATLGGLVNVRYGLWLALVTTAVTLAGSRALPAGPRGRVTWSAPTWVELLLIAVVLGIVLAVVAYALNTEEASVFVSFVVTAGGVAGALVPLGVFNWFADVAARHRTVTVLAAFLTAVLFPFTQGGSDANMSIATQILIFFTVAMGLNIVVGLAGLLDLGYVAFLGVGAYTAANLSGSAFANVGWTPPFWVAAIIGAGMAATAGLIIGAPTLRVRGDYLAIVTLAFGEIFRLAMFNLDGTTGPDISGGPNGIPAVPDLNFFGFDFGARHVVGGITLGRFSNYFFLLLLLAGFVVLVFTRLNNSRIGRGWVAMREDETAAEAMGISTFRLKLLAFALGATLAGLAGSIKAHHDVSTTPEQYVFLQSAFLLAAIVLGGMGTVVGVLLGATILQLLPEKLRFFSEYRLMLFALVLIIMMRLRPEGLVPSSRRQLEFHEEDEELAEVLDTETGLVKEVTD